MKHIFLIFFGLFWSFLLSAQTDTILKKADSSKNDNARVKVIADTSKPPSNVKKVIIKPPPPPAQTTIILPPKEEKNIVINKIDSILPSEPPSNNTEISRQYTPIASGDSVLIIDSTAILAAEKKVPFAWRSDSLYAHLFYNPYLPMGNKPVYQIVKIRTSYNKDYLFYLVAGLVFLLACIKWIFNRYFTNIFRLFIQPSFRQKQTREQLMQNNMPSLLLNLFFILSAGIFLTLLFNYYQISTITFWKLLIYCTVGLLILYLGKYIFLSFSGWVFNAREAVSTYVFSVYLVNKILGILLIPFVFILAFSKRDIMDVAVTVSYIVIGLLLMYRYIISYSAVTRDLKVNPFHFFLYILSFEVLPLLFICKSLILYINRTL